MPSTDFPSVSPYVATASNATGSSTGIFSSTPSLSAPFTALNRNTATLWIRRQGERKPNLTRSRLGHLDFLLRRPRQRRALNGCGHRHFAGSRAVRVHDHARLELVSHARKPRQRRQRQHGLVHLNRSVARAEAIGIGHRYGHDAERREVVGQLEARRRVTALHFHHRQPERRRLEVRSKAGALAVAAAAALVARVLLAAGCAAARDGAAARRCERTAGGR